MEKRIEDTTIIMDGKILASSASSKRKEEKKSVEKTEASDSSGASCKKCGSRESNLENYKVDCGSNSANDVNVLWPVNTHLAKALIMNSYRFDMQSQKYNGRISCKIPT